MRQAYINPFVTIQKHGSETLFALTTDPDKIIRIYEPAHPLYGISRKHEICRKLPLLPEKEFHFLLNRNIISFTPYDRNTMLDEIYQQKDAETHYSITLFPTLNCNNACVYCYQEHQNQARMNASDYEAVYNFILNRISQGVRHISVGLMGGEPTLENSLVLPFMKRCRNICADSDVAFNGSMTTNGRIMHPEEYISSGITSFQITLDGPPELHDRLRPGIRREKTFESILDGLILLRNKGGNDLHCSVRINHTKESITDSNFHAYLSILSEYFSGDHRFEIFHRIASDLGGNIDTSVLIPENERQAVLENANNRTLSYDLFPKSDGYLPNSRVCYAAQNNAISILPGGRLCKCTVAIDEECNYVGMLSAQGIPEFNPNIALWISGDVRGRNCNSCEVAPVCQSRSCPLERIRKGKNPCPDIKYDKSFLSRKLSNRHQQHISEI